MSLTDALRPMNDKRRCDDTAATAQRLVTLAELRAKDCHDGHRAGALVDLANGIADLLSDFEAEIEDIEERENRDPKDPLGLDPYGQGSTHPGAR